MILTCPACGTQYVVKDGAIPPAGRRVRCASCRHSWHQDPPAEETLELAEPIAPRLPEALEDEVVEAGETATVWPEPSEDYRALDVDEPVEQIEPEEAEEAVEPVEPEQSTPASGMDYTPPGYAPVETMAPSDELAEQAMDAPPEPDDLVEAGEVEIAPPGQQDDRWGPSDDDDFSPFAQRGPVEKQRRGPLLPILLAVLLIAALAAAFWFLAPPEWKARVGLAGAGETPLQLMMTHSDRQRVAPSGNELLSISGRVINPTDRPQSVPPITAELRSATGQVVYRWTIAPPTRTLGPRASATFNSSELNVPAGGDELTISLGPPSA